MKLDANDRTLRDTLKTHFFFIPRFQRPYSWELEQVEELWDDIKNSGPDYFIGSMVVYQHSDDTRAVIDGQQRLTTLMMLLCAIREAARDNGDVKLANGTHNLIERKDENDELRFVLKTETSFPFLQNEILSDQRAKLTTVAGSEEIALKAAYDRIKRYIDDDVVAIRGSSTLPMARKKQRISALLNALRDKLLGLRLILVEVGEVDSATTIFVTLNSRGKDLEPADLVKAHLLNLLPKKGQLDPPKLNWDSIVEKFDASSTPINMTDFLLAVWRSRYGATTAKKLHKDVRRQIKKPNATSFLGELLHDAELFRRVNEPEYYKEWPRETSDAVASLCFFRDFGIRQPMPLLLSLVREYDAERIRARQFSRALRAIEDYHFTWNVLANKTSTGGMSLFFARFARELLKAKNDNKRGIVINQLCAELRARRPSDSEFVEAFSALTFTNDYTSEKRVIKYVLVRLYKHADPKSAVDFGHMTIEHLASQSSGCAEVGRIGNLILVTEDLNGKLDNRLWKEKQQMLNAVKNQWVPDDVKKASTWNDTSIIKRTEELASLGRTRIWTG